MRSRVHLRAGGGRVFCGRKLRGLPSPTATHETWSSIATLAALGARDSRCRTCTRSAARREARALAMHLPGTDGP